MTKADLQLLLPALRRFAYSLTGSRADADDLTQNTLVRLLDYPTPDGVPPAQWAFRICRNLWIDEYRARRVRQTAQPQVEYETLTETDGEAQLLNDIQLTQVGKALDTLPPEQRDRAQGCLAQRVPPGLETIEEPVAIVLLGLRLGQP